MFFGRTQADNTDCVFVGASGEDQDMQPAINSSDRDETGFAIIEPVILALQRRIPFKRCCRRQRNAVLLPVAVILDPIELDLHQFNVHPFNGVVKLL